MINSDWDDSDVDDPADDHGEGSSCDVGTLSRPTRGLHNSLIETADMMLDLVQVVERPPGASLPHLTIRVSRIPEDCDVDPRFQETFDVIRAKGVQLVFGDLAEKPLSSLPVGMWHRSLRPSRRICLDPTALMAFCSDLLHHPLPADRAGAIKRFFRPKEALEDRPGGRHANGPGRAGSGDEEVEWHGQSQNSRELVKNVLEEMEAPLIEEIRDLLESVLEADEEVEWWTTPEAVRYLQEALGSEELVGEGMEQQRMKRLLGLEPGDFFEGSRYASSAGILSNIRVRVFDQDSASVNGDSEKAPPTSFHRSLSQVAQSCVDDYLAHLNKESSQRDLPNFLKPQRIPVPKVAQLSLPFPIVSLITLARGTREGMTVIMMGNVILRDLFGQPRWKCPGWVQGSYELENARGRDEVIAAVWMLPYRSLGEGKRVKFEKGDYSYPNH